MHPTIVRISRLNASNPVSILINNLYVNGNRVTKRPIINSQYWCQRNASFALDYYLQRMVRKQKRIVVNTNGKAETMHGKIDTSLYFLIKFHNRRWDAIQQGNIGRNPLKKI